MPSNPFIQYRARLDSYKKAIDRGWTDEEFVALVERLDESVATVDGHGFRTTTFASFDDLHSGTRVWVKDDTKNVSGSHKSRHLFGVALDLAVEGNTDGDLAIASCGNAAIAASVIAKAIDRTIHVFVPTWASQSIIDTLEHNRAINHVCARQEGESGDPTYLRFLEAVAAGAIPFSVQSTATPSTIDGGRTMGWELADQLIDAKLTGPVDVFIQIGGGALASATWLGLLEGLGANSEIEPVLHAVQTEACAPLVRAWNELSDATNSSDELISLMRAEPTRFMRVWDPVGTSAASGILDDVAYDWHTIIEGMASSGGWPVLVSESSVVQSHLDGRNVTGIDAEPTGTAGFAALYEDIPLGANSVVLFTGVTR